MRKYNKLLLMITCVLVGAALFFAIEQIWFKNTQEQQANQPEVEEALAKLQKAQNLIKDSYVEQVDSSKLLDGAIQGMVASLDDPYSVYMDKETSKQFEQSLDSSFSGIGAEVTKEGEDFVIVSPFKGSPAEEAGLKPNDKIISVDGKSVQSLTLYEVTAKIRGPKGSKVEIGINRGDREKDLKIVVKRDEIPIETVHSDRMKTDNGTIGYIEITTFAEGTANDLKDELTKLETEGINGLILDVRGNPGGLLSSVHEIMDQFVTGKKPFMHIEERTGEREPLKSVLKEKKDYPVVTLIDGGSASAAEILAAGMQEVEGYPLIGEKTFGKGTVQQSFELGDGSQMKLTMSKWLTPNKRWIHKKGIEPTIAVKQSPVYGLVPLQSAVVLKKGMNDEKVAVLQNILNGLGYEVDRTDGYFSTSTEKAITAFQKKSGLKENGEANTATLTELDKAIQSYKDNPKNDLQLQSALQFISEKE
ncbi:PDZ domain-containing protein [Jeotgalibacillus sp. S-D1]|uniref:S41 family peptidase n=1 Tax=Jeotgalibacillus sp. S-D1 TaxID=2552189 RepID=UPI00105A12A3|nr:S41 family peptidase [Jeotgalibacillus sp. S-D1]TDL32564.1 PDZ domain-containing protein [Jeotgalibacillus sp. S-D1]